MIPGIECEWRQEVRFPISGRLPYAVPLKERHGGARRPTAANLLEEHMRSWVERKVAYGVPENQCVLPFLTNAPKQVECRLCNKYIYEGDKVLCSVRGCHDAYHRACVKLKNDSSTVFKCPQHACFFCKQKNHLHCVRCNMAFHFKCSPWPTDNIFPTNLHGRSICWKHPLDWHLEKEHADPTSDMEEVFHHLPLVYVEEDYEIGPILNDIMDKNTEPAPYVHIRRNVYLVKRKHDGANTDIGCTNCNVNSSCGENCECRGLLLSCSRACHCSEMCTNRPFRKEKKRTKVVKIHESFTSGPYYAVNITREEKEGGEATLCLRRRRRPRSNCLPLSNYL